MSRFRHRMTVVALGGLLLGAPLLISSPARAEGPDDPDPQVTFDGSGGLFGLTCDSAPDVESLTVPADGLVKIINHTGHRARLRLGGADQGILPEGGSTKVVFRHGSTSVAVDPDCAIGQPAAPMQVTTVPASEFPALTPVPDPIQPPTFSAAPPTTAPTSTNPLRADTLAVPPATKPQTLHSPRTGTETLASRVRETKVPVPPRTSPASPALTTAPAAAPLSRADPSPSSGSAGVTAADSSGSSGDIAADSSGSASDDAGSSSGSLGLAGAGRRSLGKSDAGSLPAAEPVVALRPASSRQPIGLLALVAAVCALGVGIGAIRAFVSQRAYRSKIA